MTAATGRPGQAGSEPSALPILVVRPLTAATWPALADLFGPSGASNGCWCAYWRLGPRYRDRPREDNRRALRQLAESAQSPGLVAFAAQGTAAEHSAPGNRAAEGSAPGNRAAEGSAPGNRAAEDSAPGNRAAEDSDDKGGVMGW